jgi:hypothetical protein
MAAMPDCLQPPGQVESNEDLEIYFEVPNMPHALPFGEVLEAADHLSQEEQQELIAILHRRLVQAARQRLAADIKEARQEFAQARCSPTTPSDLMREILK